MSFRGRLRLFFALIVVVPLIALGVLLFARAEGTQTGKADARIATGLRAAMGVYAEGDKTRRGAGRRGCR